MVSMLVTRPEPEASDTAARLAALGIEPVTAPLLRFAVLPTTLPDAAGFAALAVTSANGLRALAERGDLARFAHLPAYCVGARTAAAARSLGFGEVIAGSGDTAALVAMIAEASPTGPIFYPAARERSGDLGKALARHGLMAITSVVYAMEPAEALPEPARRRLDDGAIAAALFYSRRTAEIFVALADGLARRAEIGILCLAEAVAEPLLAAHFVRVGLADYPSEEAMMALALSFARDQNVGMIAR
ncbi:MAG: uroporphyrinogen-III synthase [Devosia sp.]